MKSKAERKMARRNEIMATLIVFGIVFALVGFIGFIASAGLLVAIPFIFGLARNNSGKTLGERYGSASRPQKITIWAVLLMAIPFIILGLLWIFVGASDYLIDALIIVPIAYIGIWFFWGRKQRQASYREEGGDFEGGAKGIFQRIFSNQIVAVVMLIVVVGILIFAGTSYATSSSESGVADGGGIPKNENALAKDGRVIQGGGLTSKDNATTAGGLNPELHNASVNDASNPPSPTPVTPTSPTKRFDFINISVIAFDEHLTVSNQVSGTTKLVAIPTGEFEMRYNPLTGEVEYKNTTTKAVALSGVRVSLVGGNMRATSITDKNGFAQFKNIIIGEYDLTYTKGGYADTTVPIDLSYFVNTEVKSQAVSRDGTKFDTYWGSHPIYLRMKTMALNFNASVEFKDGWSFYWDDVAGSSILQSSGNTDSTYWATQRTIPWIKEGDATNTTVTFTLTSIATPDQVANTNRQEMLWGWSGLPYNTGLVNGLISTKTQTQSIMHSFLSGLSNMVWLTQSTIADRKTTLATGENPTNDKDRIFISYQYSENFYFATAYGFSPSVNATLSAYETFDGNSAIVNVYQTQNMTLPQLARKAYDEMGKLNKYFTVNYSYIAILPHGGDLTLNMTITLQRQVNTNIFWHEAGSWFAAPKSTAQNEDSQMAKIPLSFPVKITNSMTGAPSDPYDYVNYYAAPSNGVASPSTGMDDFNYYPEGVEAP